MARPLKPLAEEALLYIGYLLKVIDEDIHMISTETPILFAKAYEVFILELTIQSWLHVEENKRRTFQKNDIVATITRKDIFDFLVDIVLRDEIKDEVAG
ncbi:Histone H2A/H2B/H3 [Dillenia turbinata]|uniref:Histone H2A/H2B/H3 n=1 Tax=Dillenia turbinata TaxID=194707 RepID=A0AAN8W0U3_9MAGN